MPKCSYMRTIRGSCAMLFVFGFVFEVVTLLILYSFFTHTVLMLYSYFTHTLLILRRRESGRLQTLTKTVLMYSSSSSTTIYVSSYNNASAKKKNGRPRTHRYSCLVVDIVRTIYSGTEAAGAAGGEGMGALRCALRTHM